MCDPHFVGKRGRGGTCIDFNGLPKLQLASLQPPHKRSSPVSKHKSSRREHAALGGDGSAGCRRAEEARGNRDGNENGGENEL